MDAQANEAIEDTKRERLGRAHTVLVGMEIMKVCDSVDGFARYHPGESDRTVWERYRARPDAREVSIGAIGNLRHDLIGPIMPKEAPQDAPLSVDVLRLVIAPVERKLTEVMSRLSSLSARIVMLETWARDGAQGVFPPDRTSKS